MMVMLKYFEIQLHRNCQWFYATGDYQLSIRYDGDQLLIRCDGDKGMTVSDDCTVICIDLTGKLFTL